MVIGEKVMVTKKEFSNSIKKAKNWDGKSRPSNDTYRDSWDRIFGQKETDELAESLKQSRQNRKENGYKHRKSKEEKLENGGN